MKSYNHLWEKFISPDNYFLAVKNATQHKGGAKRKYRKAQYYKHHAEEMMPDVLHYAEHFYNEHHEPKIINDGITRKKREILVPSMREQIIHHMIVNVMKPIILKPLYEHSYGSVPGRGATRGKNKKTKGGKEAVERFIRNHPKDCKYCLKMDISKFFDSVPHEKLKAMFARIIHDEKFLNLLYVLTDANEKDIGMPIGFYTSQWFANFYLNGLDHFIKENLGAVGYFRYMDDMVIFDSNKRRLHKMVRDIARYLLENLGLRLNHKWQVFLFHYVAKDGTERGRFLDFMGFRFYRNRTTLRRTLMLCATRKARAICKKTRKGGKTVYDCRQMLSYKGWLTPTDTYNMYKKWIKPYISFRNLRKMLSMHDKMGVKTSYVV